MVSRAQLGTILSFCAICSRFAAVESILRNELVVGRSDRHHGEIQPSQRRPRRRRFSLRRNPRGRGSFVRSARTGGCRAGLEALVADPAAARRALRRSPAEGETKPQRLQASPRGITHRQATELTTNCDREGQLIGQEILERCGLPRSGDAGDVHRAELPDHPRCIRSGKTEIANMPGFTPPPSRAGRRTRSTTCRSPRAARPSFLGGAPRKSSALAEWRRDLGHRVQARVGNPALRATRLF